MISRGQNFQQIPINISGSSTFGRYPKISIEKTYNMFVSDDFLVPYSGYEIIASSSLFNNGTIGRGIFTSTKYGKLVVVINQYVYLVDIVYDQNTGTITSENIAEIGTLNTTTGIVYITENNASQILISDNHSLYLYTGSGLVTEIAIDFTPGYITFHDTYFIAASTGTNEWRLSGSNDGTTWTYSSNTVGVIQTKPDNIQAVVRFPSKGNMIFVMGSVVTEAWFNTGAQLFPYQRNNQFNIDYGCVSAATVAYMDTVVVWLAQNEKSGPIIMYSDGGMPKKITTDGIDYLLSTLNSPADSQGFVYRQDGHLFYHINFYSDNLSLFYDFNTDKFYHASDQNLNYFIAAEIAFIANQYYFVSKNTGNLYAFDTSYTTYQDVLVNTNTVEYTFQIPRIRICKNIRLPSQEYFVANDVGFTIESGETDYYQQSLGQAYLTTQDGDFLTTQDGYYLVTNQDIPVYTTPRVFLSVSYDGGATFGNEWVYNLPGIGYRRNRLMWWQCGIANDFVTQFRFQSIGRFVCTDGICNIRI